MPMFPSRFLAIAVLALVLVSGAASQSPKDLAAIWEKNRISDVDPSKARHADLRRYLGKLREMGVKIDEVGRSFANREIWQMEWGKGPLRIFMWSQMHGDEPTATSSLVDLFAYLQKNPDDKLVKKFSETFTIRAVPMLNPDGTELYQRFNLQGIDINRDAVDLKTPEGQLLKKLRDEWTPHIGFNLHNQNELTSAGDTTRQAAMSFLAVLGNREGITNAGHERNKRIVAAMVIAVYPFLRGHIGRYNETYNGRAFGDNFSAWGTPTILIEAGGYRPREEMFLVQMKFVAFLAAFQSIADGSEQKLSPINYDLLPINSSGRLAWFVFRGGHIIDPRAPEQVTVTDIAVNRSRRRAETATSISGIGRLEQLAGLDEFDASGFYVLPRLGRIAVGEPGELLFFKRSRSIDWKSQNFASTVAPDAVFSQGRWTAGEGVVPSKPGANR
jgi:hypothetical protein